MADTLGNIAAGVNVNNVGIAAMGAGSAMMGASLVPGVMPFNPVDPSGAASSALFVGGAGVAAVGFGMSILQIGKQ